MFRKPVVGLSLLFMLFSSVLFSGTVSAETRILFNSFFPPQHFLTRDVMRGWARDVQRVTEGRVKVTIPASSAAPPPQLWNAVTSGIVDGAYMFNGLLEDRLTLPVMPQLPWATTGSAESTSVALWRTYNEFFRDAGTDEYQGVQLIGLFAAPGGEMYSMTDEPLETVEQLESRRIWALPGTTAKVMQNMGISAVSGPAVRIHETVSTGVVEGFVGIPLIDADGFKALNYARSVTTFPRNITIPTFSMFLSPETWEAISEEDREAIMSVSGETLARRVGKAFDEANAAVRENLRKKGIPFVDGSDALYQTMREAGEPLIADWIEAAGNLGVDGEAAMAYFQEQLEEVDANRE